MRRRRRKRNRRNGRFHYGLFAGMLLFFLAGIGVFAWGYTQKNLDLQMEKGALTSAGLYRLKEEEKGSDFAQSKSASRGGQPETDGADPLETEPVTGQSEEAAGIGHAEQESHLAKSQEELLEQEIEAILDKMTLDEKIYQMFILTPEQLTGISPVTAAGDATKDKLAQYPVGGLIYFASNLLSEEQTKEMLNNTRAYGEEIEGLPLFLCIDEEGGRVARIGKNPAFSVKRVGPMGQLTTEEEAYQAGAVIGAYLRELGFNTDFAPDADVLTNEKNTVIGDRSFGSDPNKVALMAAAVSKGLHAEGILSAFKHFPGHGATEGDTHEGYAYTEKTYEELKAAELVPFTAAGECGADMVMAAHISLPKIVGDNTPASLSYKMITEVLREDLGFQGLVITDAMNMGAIGEHYSAEEAAVKAVEAGVDLLLMPKDFREAFQGIKKAVSSGRIGEGRIEESLQRILRVKLQMGQAPAAEQE